MTPPRNLVDAHRSLGTSASGLPPDNRPPAVPVRPPALRPGDPVAVVAPASPPRTLEAYERGLGALRRLYDVRFAWAPGAERGYLAAPDADRVDALHAALRASEIRALFCVRGGYGTLRLLNRLRWPLVRRHPTLLVGYSDITALQMALYAQAGWTSLSGPVVTEWAEADDETIEHVRQLAQGRCPPLASDLTALRPGTARGPLLGGNLSVLTRLLGTPYAPQFAGSILCLEDVAEAPYRVDRMFAHLEHAGILRAVNGVVLGDFTTDPDTSSPGLSLEEVLRDYLADRPYPVATGLSYGHVLPRRTLPLGGHVILEVGPEGGTLTLSSPIVR